eukprot:15131239-Alexandrium_andersonii.AAC.1
MPLHCCTRRRSGIPIFVRVPRPPVCCNIGRPTRWGEEHCNSGWQHQCSFGRAADSWERHQENTVAKEL